MDNWLGLWITFNEWWPAWPEHVASWSHFDSQSIMVRFKEDDYMMSGVVYIFGKSGKDQWFLKRYQEEQCHEQQ